MARILRGLRMETIVQDPNMLKLPTPGSKHFEEFVEGPDFGWAFQGLDGEAARQQVALSMADQFAFGMFSAGMDPASFAMRHARLGHHGVRPYDRPFELPPRVTDAAGMPIPWTDPTYSVRLQRATFQQQQLQAAVAQQQRARLSDINPGETQDLEATLNAFMHGRPLVAPSDALAQLAYLHGTMPFSQSVIDMFPASLASTLLPSVSAASAAVAAAAAAPPASQASQQQAAVKDDSSDKSGSPAPAPASIEQPTTTLRRGRPYYSGPSVFVTTTHTKRKYGRQRPEKSDFATEEEFTVAFAKWRERRDKNNRAVQRSRNSVGKGFA
eukprot:m.222820 g.222820  ORF g.222820 m.222820 type:complete len:327 (+) comp10830_c0_seq1:3-983(+)